MFHIFIVFNVYLMSLFVYVHEGTGIEEIMKLIEKHITIYFALGHSKF